MANFKIAFVYSQPIAKGFTEVYYRVADTIQQAATFSTNLLNHACNLRHPLTVLRKIRVSDTLGNRSSLVVAVNQGGNYLAGSGDQGPDITGVSAVCLLASVAKASSRRVWLRGLSDTAVTRSSTTGLDTPTEQLRSAINNWIASLSRNNFAIRSLVKLGTPPNVYQRINSITGTVAQGKVTVTFTGVNQAAVGQRIIISQVSPKLYPGINGHWTVLAIGSNTFDIGYNLDQVPPSAVTVGKWRPEGYEYGQITEAISDFDHFGTRTTGAGFTAGRGRRRALHLRSL
jgi:hypothetical protein